MSLVKTWTTEILLDVTNNVMQLVSKEVVQYEKGIILKVFFFKSNIRFLT